MKAFKWIAIVVGGLVALLVIGIGILTATFDPNKYKDDITRVVKEKKNRTLAIPGNLTLKVFPKIGVETGAVTLSEFKSDKTFVKLERAKVFVDLLPLLRKEVIVDRVELEGLNATVIRGKDGKFNFDDLLSKDESPQSQVKFDVDGVKVSNAALTYRDEGSGQSLTVSSLNATTGRVAPKVPVRLAVTAQVDGQKPLIKGTTDVSGELTFDLDKKLYNLNGLDAKLNGTGFGFTGLSAAVKGTIKADMQAKAIDAQSLDATLTGNYKAAAEKGRAGVDLSGANIKLSANDLKANPETLEIAANKIALDAKGTLNKEPFEVKLTSPKLTANGKNGAVQAEKIDLTAKGRQGNQSGSIKLEAAKIDADSAKHRVAVEGLIANGSGAFSGLLLNDFKARAPKLLINLEGNQIALDGVTFAANGKTGEDNFDIKVDAPKLNVSRDAASGEAITGQVKVSGKDTVDAKFSLSDVKGSGKALTVGQVAVDLAQAKFGETNLSGKIGTSLTANLEAKQFDMARINADVTVANPQMPMKSVRLPIVGSARADLAKETANADIGVKFDESDIKAKAGVTRFKNPALNFDVAIDKLNVDKYFPPKPPGAKGTETEKPIDLSALKTLNANGTVKIGALQVNNIKANNVSLTVKAAGGKVDVAPMSAALYGGSLSGTASVNANNNSYAAKQNLKDVNLNPLMKDAVNKDVLEGRGNVDIDVTTSGTLVSQIKKNLNGSVVTTMRDGAYKGMNLAKSFREWKAMAQLNKNKVQEARKDEKTDFTEFKTAASIKNGVATLRELNLLSPFVRVGPNKRQDSTVDIGNDTMNMLIDATVVGSPKGQDADFAGLKGVTIPVALYGPLSEMKYDIKWGEIGQAILKQAAEGKLDKAKESVKDKINERLGIKKPDSPAPAAGGTPAPAGQAPAGQAPQKSKEEELREKAKDKLKGIFGK